MRRLVVAWFALAAALLAALLAAPAAMAGVSVQIDLSTQRMTVTEDGRVRHSWAISSGRPGYRTPTGSYRPTRLARMHYSRKYDLAPMPHSIFFRGGYAIHGTGEVRRLGRTASHGCVRLPRAAAAELFRLVQARGPENTRITITGDASLADAAPAAPRRVAAGRQPPRVIAEPARVPRVATARAKAGGGKTIQRRTPLWDDRPAYGYAPVHPSQYDTFWAPRRGYR